MEETVRKFSEVRTRYPNRADIEGHTETRWSGKDISLADPIALGRKVGILGVPWR